MNKFFNYFYKEQRNNLLDIENKKNISCEPRIIVHLGPHKTATTSFQNILESNEKILKEEGIFLITVRSSFSEIYKKIRIDYMRVLNRMLLSKSNDEQRTVVELAGHFNNLIEAVKLREPKVKKIVISDENILGPLPGHYFAGRGGKGE